MAVQVSYYNECLAAWEPLLEPVMVENEKTMWQVQLKVTVLGVTASICFMYIIGKATVYYVRSTFFTHKGPKLVIVI